MSDLSINEKIAEYKKEHPEVKNLSREKIISIMKLEKTESEKVYHTGEKTDAGSSFNAVNSAFGTGFGMSDDLIPRWQTKNIEPKYSKEEAVAMQFLKQIVSSADANMDYQDKHEGYISKWVVNLVKEAGNTVYAKSNVKKAISDTKSDIIILENAASGQIDKDFTGNKLTFKEAFRTQRGVEFDEKKILNCEEKSKEMANVQLAKDITDKLKNTLDRATVNNASNTGMVDANEAIKDTFMFLGVKKQSDINNILKNIETKHRDDDVIKKYGGDFRIAKNKAGKYMIYRTAKDGYPAEATMEELQIIAKEMKFMINQAYASSINAEIPENVTPEQLEKITDKKYASHKAEYQKSFKEAYGKKDLEALSEKYMQSQQQGTAYIETGINIVSMATMFMGSGILLKGMNYGSKALKATNFASKAEKVVGLTAKATAKAEKLSGVLMANQIAQPVKLIENLTSEEADWKSYGLSAAEGTMWMALGAASGTLGDKARMVLKQKGLSGLVKNSGKSLDELMSLYKSGHQLPEGLAKAFNAIDKCATITGSSLELSADLLLTYAGNKALHGEDLSMNDVLMSVNGVAIGAFMQKKISNLKNEDKVKIIKQDLLQKNPNLSKAELEKRTNAVMNLTDLIVSKAHTVNDVKNVDKTLSGLTIQENDIILDAKVENPADIVSNAIVKKAIKDGEFDDRGIRLNTPESLDNELKFYEENPNIHKENMETVSLIINGKLNEHLKERYNELKNVFKEIALNRTEEIEILLKESDGNNQKFADGVIEIFAKDFGMDGYQPEIEFKSSKDLDSASGGANWLNGKIEINEEITDSKELVEIIAHEFTHMLQYRDILAQYGRDGIREIIMNDKTISTKKKESTINAVLKSSYTQKLLDSYDFQRSEKGSVNDYIVRIYKDEFTNTLRPEDGITEYTNQVTEREAYHLGSNNLGIRPNKPKNNKEALRAFLKKNFGSELKEHSDISSKEISMDKYNDGAIDEYGQLHRKEIPAGISAALNEINLSAKMEFTVKNRDNTLRFTPEGEKAARNSALEIHNAAEKKESEIIEIMEKYGLGVSKKNMTHRPKSSQSIYDKIKNDMLNIKYPASFEKALKGVRDAVGTRTELEDFDYKKHPDIVEMFKTDPEKAYLMASERQSEPYVNKLKEIILAQAEGESDISAIKISNYKGKNGISYFSDRQVAELRDLAAEYGIDLDVKDKTSKIRPSGYTALQMNFVTKDGFTFEWQLRGSGVNKFAECEHVPYDIRENKDVTGGNPKLKKLYKPLEGIVKSMTDDEMKEYNMYLTEHYEYLRKKELGFDVEPPVLNEKFDSRLSADNLEILHDIAVKVKSGEDCTELIKDFEEHLRDVPSWAERKTLQIGEFIPYVRKNDKQRFEDMKSKLLALYPEEDLLNNPLTAKTYENIFSNLQKHIDPDNYDTLLERAAILKDKGDVLSSFGLLKELSTMPEAKFNAVVKYLDGKEYLYSDMLYNIVKVSSEFSPIDKNLPLLMKNGINEVTVKNLKNLRDRLEERLFDLAHVPEMQDDIIAFSDIVFKLEDKIQDPIVEKRVNDLIDYACKADYLAPYFKETNVLLDIVNTSKGKYNSINGELYEAYKKYVNVEAEKVQNNKNNKNLSKDEALVLAKENLMEAVEKGTQLGLNFQQDLKYEALKRYFNECGPKANRELAQHLYKEYYTKDLPELVAKECENIQKEFGTAVFLTDKEDFSAANKIYHEFKIFSDAARNAGDYAIFPPTLDCSIFDVSFINTNTAGFICHDVERIKLKGHENIGYALRHELMHGNDKEECKDYGVFGPNKEYDFTENSPILKQKKWYRNEFANAGIPEWHIDYAYENRSEFIAVAAEGDFTKYSPEFKKVLVDLGMPEWAFDMPMNTLVYRLLKDIGE